MPDLGNQKLKELRSRARELNIPVTDIRKHGDLRCRSTWINAIQAAANQQAEAAIAHEETPNCIKLVTCDQNDHKFTLIQNEPAIAHSLDEASTSGQNDQMFRACYRNADSEVILYQTCNISQKWGQVHSLIQNNDEVSLVDGQLAGNGVPLPDARTVADLVNAGQWAEAFQLVSDNERATRILSRIREVLAA